MRLPPLAVGLGVYLPPQVTLMIVVGALAGAWFDHRAQRVAQPESAHQMGVLMASGLIVGESILGVLIAAIVVFSGHDAPLALVGPAFAPWAVWIGAAAFIATAIALYRWALRTSDQA